MKKKVLIGLSGGVDSSVAAYLLKKQGFEVIALYMINWKDSSVTLSGECSWEEDLIVAKLVANKLGIHLEVVDSSQDYKKNVVDYMFAEYEKGRTPNPDILCNREIKFDVFYKNAKKFEADFIATGHYAQTENIENESGKFVRLLKGNDNNKDQSYFLCQLSQNQLKNVLFPIGNIEKAEVRRIATEINLASADKKDSQGICFVGKVDLPTFLQQKLIPKKGKIIEIDNYDPVLMQKHIMFNTFSQENLSTICKSFDFKKTKGTVVGEHKGAHFFTIGQRKGLNIGGKAQPVFVIGIDTDENIVYVGQNQNHNGLFRKGLFIRKEEIHWIRPDMKLKNNQMKKCMVRIRYRQPLQNAELRMHNDGMYIIFNELQRGITAGQFAAWYYDEELVGSGVINS